MFDVEIPKEVQQENKILLGLTLRQTICMAVGAGAAFLIGVVLQLPIDVAIVPMGVIGIIAMGFGWIKRDGLPLERIIAKRVVAMFYGNARRPYKTKNAFVTMINKAREEEEARRKAEKKTRGRKRRR